MTDHLRVGVGRTDITPPLGTALMGYPDPAYKRTATSVRDPLHATALALKQGGRAAIVLSMDVTIVEDEQVAHIRRGVQEQTGVAGDHVTVCAIQTHSAPRTQRVWGWCDMDWPYVNDIMVPRAIEAVTKAWQAMVPVRVGVAETRSLVGINRRQINEKHQVGLGNDPWAPIDPIMTVLRFESAKGTLANLVHYGAHPTVFGGASRVISRDWPGVMIDRMESLTGAPTLFVNGAVGDIAPRTNSGRATGDGTGEAAIWEAGAVAGLDAMRAWRSVRDLRDLALNVAAVDLPLPYRPLAPLEVAKQELAKAEPNKDQAGTGMCEYKHWRSVVEAYGQTPASAKPYRQTLTALGPVALVPMPGEPFASTVLRLREASPFAHTLCASTSCGNNGYLCARESLHRGGYETWVGRAFGPYILAENIDDVLVERNLAALRPMWQQLNPPLPES